MARISDPAVVRRFRKVEARISAIEEALGLPLPPDPPDPPDPPVGDLGSVGPQKVGDVFEISRAGADSGGPWELRVRNGTDTVIAALTVNQWARCVWTGTAWALLSRGSLT